MNERQAKILNDMISCIKLLDEVMHRQRGVLIECTNALEINYNLMKDLTNDFLQYTGRVDIVACVLCKNFDSLIKVCKLTEKKKELLDKCEEFIKLETLRVSNGKG